MNNIENIFTKMVEDLSLGNLSHEQITNLMLLCEMRTELEYGSDVAQSLFRQPVVIDEETGQEIQERLVN